MRDEKWFEWKFLKCPFKSDILCFEYDSQYVLAFFDKSNKNKKLNILYILQKKTYKKAKFLNSFKFGVVIIKLILFGIFLILTIQEVKFSHL